jgi:type III pantothenate kinase
MLLAIDIGNTNLTIGLYKGDTFGAHWRLGTDHRRMPDEYGLQLLGLLEHARLQPSDLNGVSLSSVVPQLTPRLIEASNRYLHQDPLVIGPDLNTGITIKYHSPASVGPDRIADAAATVKMYGAPAIIVDFGTATTFNVLNAEKEYLGGAIAPGVLTAADALTEHTSRLPRIDVVKPPSVIGTNTVHAMQSGLYYGYVALVEGMITRMKAELKGQVKTIATGGLAELIAQDTKIFDIISPWLTLEGLRIIWELNRNG